MKGVVRARPPTGRGAASANQITQQILTYLRLRGVFVWRQNSGAMKIGERYVKFGAAGAGDILGLTRGGVFISIEVKAGRDRLRDSQLNWMDEVRRHGGVCIVARSVDDVVEWFEGRQHAT